MFWSFLGFYDFGDFKEESLIMRSVLLSVLGGFQCGCEFIFKLDGGFVNSCGVLSVGALVSSVIFLQKDIVKFIGVWVVYIR